MRKKLSIVLLSMALLSSLSYAEELTNGERFIGLEVGASTIQANTGGIFGEDNVKGTDAEFGIRIGAQNKDWRTIIALNYYDNKESDQNYERGLLGFDYYLLTSQFKSASFKPYLGVHGGYMNYESTQKDEDGFFYGGQAGFTLDVTKEIDVDVAYRYSLGDMNEVDHIGNFVLGVNYLY
ncbi:MAG: outer membrane beta-barrel protein [Campylobacterales bacterium]|nr:outer membrane beta-barrel protein [Campylobacterales bacterium]